MASSTRISFIPTPFSAEVANRALAHQGRAWFKRLLEMAPQYTHLEPKEFLMTLVLQEPTSEAAREIFEAAAEFDDQIIHSAREMRQLLEADKQRQPLPNNLEDREYNVVFAEKNAEARMPFVCSSVAFAVLVAHFPRATAYRNADTNAYFKSSVFQAIVKNPQVTAVFENLFRTFLTQPDESAISMRGSVPTILGGSRSDEFVSRKTLMRRVIAAVMAKHFDGATMEELWDLVGTHLQNKYFIACDAIFTTLADQSGFNNVESFIKYVMPLALSVAASSFLRKYQSAFKGVYPDFEGALRFGTEGQELYPFAAYEQVATFAILMTQLGKSEKLAQKPAYLNSYFMQRCQVVLAPALPDLLEKIFLDLLVSEAFKENLLAAKSSITKIGGDFRPQVEALFSLVVFAIPRICSLEVNNLYKTVFEEKGDIQAISKIIIPMLLRDQAVMFLQNGKELLSMAVPALKAGINYCASTPVASSNLLRSSLTSSLGSELALSASPSSSLEMKNSKDEQKLTTTALVQQRASSAPVLPMHSPEMKMNQSETKIPVARQSDKVDNSRGLPPPHPGSGLLRRYQRTSPQQMSPQHSTKQLPSTPPPLPPSAVQSALVAAGSFAAKAAAKLNNVGGMVRGGVSSLFQQPAPVKKGATVVSKASSSSSATPEVTISYF